MKDYYGGKKFSYYKMKYTEYRDEGSVKEWGIEDLSGARLEPFRKI